MDGNNKRLKAIIWASVWGSVFFLAGVLTVGLCAFFNAIPAGTATIGGQTISYGVWATLDLFLDSWLFRGHQFVSALFVQIVTIAAVTVFLIAFIDALCTKRYLRIFPSLMFLLSAGFFPFFITLGAVELYLEVSTPTGILAISAASFVDLVAIVVFMALIMPLLRHAALVLGRWESGEKKEPAALPSTTFVSQGLTEREAREIVNDAMREMREILSDVLRDREPVVHVITQPAPATEEKPAPQAPVEQAPAEPAPAEPQEKKEPAPAPKAKKPAPEPAPVYDEELEPDEEDDDGTPSTYNGLVAKKRATFDETLAKSDLELRHNYYNLRDYIRWYEVKMRKSNNGRSFRLHTTRYVYLTISGKHLKVYFAVDPDKYAGTTMPITKVTAQKFQDVPTMLKVRSGLSYRRAKQLIDDAMAAGGIPKPSTPEPKERGAKK